MNYKGRKHFLLLSLVFVLNVGCKTISVQQERQVATTHQLYLGCIGEQKTTAFQSNFKMKTIPFFDSRIRLETEVLPFNNQTYKAYQSAMLYDSDSISKINYNDTIVNKPQFIKLTIANELELIETLNAQVNQKLNEYLKINDNAGAVTSLSIAMNTGELHKIKQADEFFLTSSDLGTPVLELYKNEQLLQTIRFEDQVTFAYKVSNFCWQEDSKYKTQIVAITAGTACPKKTYTSAKKAKKEIDYFKF